MHPHSVTHTHARTHLFNDDFKCATCKRACARVHRCACPSCCACASRPAHDGRRPRQCERSAHGSALRDRRQLRRCARLRARASLLGQKTGGATCADGVGTPGRLLAPVSTHSILEDLTYQLNSPSASAGNSARVPPSTVRCSRHCSVPQRRSERRAPVNTEAALLCGFRTHGPLGR
jgi:hypothetical protein